MSTCTLAFGPSPFPLARILPERKALNEAKESLKHLCQLRP